MITEMYTRGLSVRDVEAAPLEAAGAFVRSDTAVSQVPRRLGAQYEAVRECDLSTCAHASPKTPQRRSCRRLNFLQEINSLT